MVGSEGLGGLEVQKFKVVRKVMAVWVVEFSNGVYKIRKIFA